MKKKKYLILIAILISVCLPFNQVTSVKASQGDYLKDLLTYQFELDNVTYQLPLKVSAFEKEGWVLTRDDEKMWSFGIAYTTMTKGDKTIDVGIINPTDAETDDYSNMLVFSIRGSELTLPGKITKGSTKSEVLNAYGTPYHKDSKEKPEGKTEIYDSNYYMSYIDKDFKQTAYESISAAEITIYSNDDKVTSMEMKYLDLDLDSIISKNEPTISYDAPVSLGKSILSFHVKLEGDLYRIPAPFTDFIDNGWKMTGIYNSNTYKLETKELPKYIGVTGYLTIGLKKNGHVIYVEVANEDKTIQKLQNCTVRSVSFTNKNTPVFTLPNKVTSLPTEKKLISTYKNDTYIKSNKNKVTKYSYYHDRTEGYPNKYHQHSDGYYNGVVNFEISSGKVSKVTIKRTTLDYIGTHSVTVKEKAVKIKTNEEVKEYFLYSNFSSSTWRNSAGYVIQFGKDNSIHAYNAGSGNPWFLQSGDFVDAVATYSFDADHNTIIINDYDRTIKVKYNVINSERVFITVNGYTSEFTTTHVKVSENGPAEVSANIKVTKGKTKTLTPKLPDGVTYKVTFKSSNTKVATISSKGKITGKKKGNATITTTIKIGSISKQYKTKVTVK